MMTQCRLCGRQCLADRTKYKGRCGAGHEAGFSAALLHHGEEPPLSGYGVGGGSGTIFFTRCVLSCLFCQNWQISQAPSGRELDPDGLSGAMLDLAADGAFNINLVSPTPYVPPIVKALELARAKGLNLPVVYNTGGYDAPEALAMMDGLVDIYLPDIKMAPRLGAPVGEPDEMAKHLLGAADYPWVNRAALLEMFRQVGHLKVDDDSGLAQRGLMVRHLVLPGGLARTGAALKWLAAAFGPSLWLSLMAQYYPAHRALDEESACPAPLRRTLTAREYDKAVDLAVNLGFDNALIQYLDSSSNYKPDFSRQEIFR